MIQTFKIVLSIILISTGIKVFCQTYSNSLLILEGISGETNFSDLIENKGDTYKIEYYQAFDDEKIKLISSCIFTNQGEDIIKANDNRIGRSIYIKFLDSYVDDKGNSIKHSQFKTIDKNGKISPSWNYHTHETKIIGNDSIIISATWFKTSENDSLCIGLRKWIYREDTLIRFDKTFSPNIRKQGLWDFENEYMSCTFDYSKQDTIIETHYSMKNDTIISLYGTKIQICNIEGNLIGEKYYNEKGEIYREYKTIINKDDNWIKKETWLNQILTNYNIVFYKDGRWFKTEYWENGKLIKYYIKTPIGNTR